MPHSLAVLRRRIRSMRGRRRPLTWQAICQKLNILKANGQPDTGLAFDIAASDSYYPSRPEVCARLGIRRVCPSCKRAILGERHFHRGLIPPHQAWWKGLKAGERDQHIQHLWKEHCHD